MRRREVHNRGLPSCRSTLDPVRRVPIIASASGNGKTTLGRALAERLGVRFVELDALVHGPNWSETPDDELRARLELILAQDGWVIDGNYTSKIGTLVLDAADTIVWLDLPTHVGLWRLLRRTHRRVSGREQLWDDNKETWSVALWGRESKDPRFIDAREGREGRCECRKLG